ncbi:ABC transporter ATP-binding protein [Tepidanaerobacter acetatoxydans]|uniref:ABC transporter ATP-binding protein n=1 Tax=Tepidanaerobacter acetatoxydans TaxID=499229 RepID=UPI001BD4896A|nr:ABC transporter ATP-binding protein [Tepidanaerobacter acetatoxydans]
MDKLLDVKNLEVNFKTYGGTINAVRGMSFDLDEGECLAIVGESGCGKSVTAKAIMGLIPCPPGEISGGSILFDGTDLLKLDRKSMMKIRGAKIGMIFQDPMTYLNPTMTVGKQIEEVLKKHTNYTKKQMTERIIEILNFVGIANPKRRMRQYPFELSGGMRQRVMIAIATVCTPKLLIADEPTTALDVTIQAQILELIKSLQKSMNTSVMLITHDLGVVANMADRVMVVYAGKIVESGVVDDVFYKPQHPYTWGLLSSIPTLELKNKEKLPSIEGTPPDLFSPPTGCAFAARCAFAMKICKEMYPETVDLGEGHRCACWLLHEKAKNVRQSFNL